MKMSMQGQMRMEQRMKLAPKMIQSMEILQLPLLALEERIEAEMNSNPVLEAVEDVDMDRVEREDRDSEIEKDLVVNEDGNKEDDFERLANVETDFEDYMDRGYSVGRQTNTGEPDKKLEALNNTAAPDKSLHDHLLEQWRLIDADDKIKEAGEQIIDFIDEKGYLTVHIEQLYNKDRHSFTVEHLNKALSLIQELDPAGVGARNLKECLLIQLEHWSEDISFEKELISKYMDELLENRIPDIANKMNCNPERINEAISRLSKLDTSPGLQVGRYENYPITADIVIEPDDEGGYIVRHADNRLPTLRVNRSYMKMSKNREVQRDTRQFLKTNIRNARWLMDAIEQRKNTLLRVATAIVGHQKEFLEKGHAYLKPLPMATIADEIGVHVATVSRAVAGKYAQCPQGIIALREFFSGGVDNSQGQSHSYDAIRAKLAEIVANEDKSKPLNDDKIREKLEEAGLGKIARRTVAKYRKLMDIPSARFRRKY